jgi:hypothetical protein
MNYVFLPVGSFSAARQGQHHGFLAALLRAGYAQAVRVTRIVECPPFLVGSASLNLAKSRGCLFSHNLKTAHNLTRRSTRTQPQAAVSFRSVTIHRPGFALRLSAAGPVNFKR